VLDTQEINQSYFYQFETFFCLTEALIEQYCEVFQVSKVLDQGLAVAVAVELVSVIEYSALQALSLDRIVKL